MAEVGHHPSLQGRLAGSAAGWSAQRMSRPTAHRKTASGVAYGGLARHGPKHGAVIGLGVRHGGIDWLILSCITLPLISALAGLALLLTE